MRKNYCREHGNERLHPDELEEEAINAALSPLHAHFLPLDEVLSRMQTRWRTLSEEVHRLRGVVYRLTEQKQPCCSVAGCKNQVDPSCAQ